MSDPKNGAKSAVKIPALIVFGRVSRLLLPDLARRSHGRHRREARNDVNPDVNSGNYRFRSSPWPAARQLKCAIKKEKILGDVKK
jgi:hypothetical protein